MADRAEFSGFKPYELTSINVTDQELGHGSYASVLKLDYFGLKCAGKKIHEALLSQGSTSYTLRRFEEECRLLSCVRHPNIVQFLGVHFQPGHEAPVLVMEFLSMNLSSCIEQHGVQSTDISYSILYDVALGLCYLHKHTPPIIHRDLSSNNVLLDSNLKAKISDLGVARILNLTPLQVSHMTQTPGTPTYMPPEVMVANPLYNKSIDIFSYGILMIHILCGSWPEPQIGPSHVVAGKLIPVTEAERRRGFLQAIGDDHPLMDLILKCINNDPQMRAGITEVTQQLADMTSQYPNSFSNRLEILKHIKLVEEEREFLKKEGHEKFDKIQQIEAQITNLKEEGRLAEQHRLQEIERLNLVHMTEVEQLQLQVRDLLAQKELQKSMSSGMQKELEEKDALISLKDDTISRKDMDIKAMEGALEEKDAITSATCERLTKVREYLTAKKQVLQANITWKQCADLPVELAEGQTTVINNKIFCSGNAATSEEYVVYCYDQPKDKWSSLPQLPVKYFGLGQANGELVAIGGMRKGADVPTNEVYLYDASIQRWKQTFMSMTTSRAFPGVLSLKSVLIVAGGLTDVYDDEYTDVVEIFKTDVSQWYRTDSLPTACHYMSMIADGSICYAIGESTLSIDGNKVFYSSFGNLIHNAIPTNQTGTSGNTCTQLAWKMLPSTPSYQPAAAVLDGHLLAVGGWKTSKEGARKKEVYVYSSTMNSWAYICDLPAPQTSTAIATLSQTEILVVGGYGGDDNKVSSAYKGTLNMKV